MRFLLLLALSTVAAAALPLDAARAAEGGASHYLPGTAGDLGFALPPQPGLQAGNVLWIQTGDASRAVLQGKVNVALDMTVVLNLVALTWTTERTVLGATWSFGAVLPFGRAELEATLTGPAGGRVDVQANSFALSDAAFVPVQLNWSVGEHHFKLTETIIAPTGAYDVDDVVNLGRNYWSFDTSAAWTWLRSATGTEASVAAGLMINTENPDTNYRTGTEFHTDFVANQFLSPTFALGPRGYWYQQITGDSGAGARLGDFKSSAFGLGLGLVWTPADAGGRLALAGKWMHDLYADNRFKSDYVQLTLGWKF